MSNLIDRQAAIDAVCMEWCNVKHQDCKHPFDDEKDDYYWCDGCETVLRTLPDLPSAQPERLTDDDFETIRIHLNAYKEKLCNQQRWEEAEECQRIIDRFMSFTSKHLPKGEWLRMSDFSEKDDNRYKCSRCGNVVHHNSRMDLYTFNSWCGRCGSNNRRYTERRTDE